MIAAIADARAVIWCLFSDTRLAKAASAFIDDTIAIGDHIGVSAMPLAEIAYLVEKERIPANTGSICTRLSAILSPYCMMLLSVGGRGERELIRRSSERRFKDRSY